MKIFVRRAFTMIEMLVVITIMSILAALLFPVLHSARNQAKKDVCLSNLRQLGSSIALYVQDYDDKLPYAADLNSKVLVANGVSVHGNPLDNLIKTTTDIRSVIKKYGADAPIFCCPQDRNTLSDFDSEHPHKSTWYEEFGSSYQYNEVKGLSGQTLGSFAAPSDGYLMGDYGYFHGGTSGADGRVNVLFADAHVKTVTWQQRSAILDASR